MSQEKEKTVKNRKRKKQIIIRFSDDEHAIFLQKMLDAGFSSQSDFIRKSVLGYAKHKQEKEHQKRKDVVKLVNQIAWIGNNLNQSARALNILKNKDDTDKKNLAQIAFNLDIIAKEFVILNEHIEQEKKQE